MLGRLGTADAGPVHDRPDPVSPNPEVVADRVLTVRTVGGHEIPHGHCIACLRRRGHRPPGKEVCRVYWRNEDIAVDPAQRPELPGIRVVGGPVGRQRRRRLCDDSLRRVSLIAQGKEAERAQVIPLALGKDNERGPAAGRERKAELRLEGVAADRAPWCR
jgi:hypothetical protein